MTATIRILSQGAGWRLDHDGQSVAFPTRSAALIAAAAAVERAIRDADGVRITVDPEPEKRKPN
jgi:hypothetical protein